ncbi:hypothetical protein DSO57_1005179 [Entomophthora muscae]|uniref:Uncharacterized protein n=1 Tax=Entomophthora muscae TaxID=34485 RepID=A0ACC2SKU7_9FUNG|nr:hypothetical protein DSO57_1005179 [Entomophthora muscae]
MRFLLVIFILILAGLVATALYLTWVRNSPSQRQKSHPEYTPLLQETQCFYAPPIISEEFNLSHTQDAVTLHKANSLVFNKSSTLQTYNPLREDTTVHFEISVPQLPPSAELLIGFCPLTYAKDPESLTKLSLAAFYISHGQVYLRGLPSPHPIAVLSPGDTVACILTIKPELKVTLSINGVSSQDFFPKLDSCIWSLNQVYPTLHATHGVQLSYSVELSEIEPSHITHLDFQ